ncbi:MAG: hypothetical protein KGH65_03455 [Candidatus Micrarchaeota archaeon]|nr:hypothetical protein [Candidatus Micrarchaeota archaeon]
MFRNKNNQTKTKLGEIIESGQKVTTSGDYVYVAHSNKDEDKGCSVVEKATSGLFLAAGTKVPGLICCEHKVKWQLVTLSPYDKRD